MKKYSIISSLIFIVLTYVFYKIPRTEIKSELIEQNQLSENSVFSDWKIKTTYNDFISPRSVHNYSTKTIYLGKEIFGDDITYVRFGDHKNSETIFIKGIHTKDFSYIFICLLMGLQFYILIGMTEKKEGLFLNAYCIFLIVIQFIYMLRLVFI